jgi:hypothetical protein
MPQDDESNKGLKNKLIYLAMKNGQDNPAACVIDENEWSITIMFMGKATVIPRSEIKSIQIKGSC